MALVGLAVAVVLFGLAFPELLAPAVAVAVLAAIVALDWVLPSGELRQFSGHHWMRRLQAIAGRADTGTTEVGQTTT